MKQSNQKINQTHLSRKAIVYLRQSSLKQVTENLESQRLQYALRDKALNMGFSTVEVIDCDLGFSAGLGAKRREGFKQLLASVALGEVGMVMSREVSRLSRTDKDWCQLLEVCQVFDTLIGDADQVYDLSLMDDQLILGIKGTLSVVELKVLKSRMLMGQEEKARRGALFRLIAPGYVLDLDKKLVKDPNLRVQEAIGLVFTKFRECWSGRQTHKWFHENGVTLPVNRSGSGKVELIWQLPRLTFIKSILKNPIYAGVYVYGRRKTSPIVENGVVIKKVRNSRSYEDSRVFINDHHEGYISWQTYKENQELLRKNNLNLGKDESVAVIRKGSGLLGGLLRCGRCGRRLHVRYWGKSGTAARYLCSGDFPSGGNYCIGFGGNLIDSKFSEYLAKSISPLGVEASLKFLEDKFQKNDGKYKVIKKQLVQLEYEAKRAFEQYNEADPRNRLVAVELETRWNRKLEDLEKIKKELLNIESNKVEISDEERLKIMEIGKNFENIWNSKSCPIEEKKKIIRILIDEIIVNVIDGENQNINFIVNWKGGSHTEIRIKKPTPRSGEKVDHEVFEIVKKMAEKYNDSEIARVLNKLQDKAVLQKSWSQSRVTSFRKANKIESQRQRQKLGTEIFSLAQAATYCRVSNTTITKLVENKILPMTQIAPWAPWEILKTDLENPNIKKIIKDLKKTGKLKLEGTTSDNQLVMF